MARPSPISYLSSAICYPPSAICHLLALWHTLPMSWWRTAREEAISARLAAPADRAALSALLADTWRRQGILAIEDQAALLRSGLSTIAFAQERAVGFLGLSPRSPTGTPPEFWTDVSLASVATNRPVGRVLGALLESARPALRGQGVTGLICLAGEGWLRDGLSAAGFVQVDRVLSYTHTPHREAPRPIPVARLRMAGAEDADAVLAINASAFAPFWCYDDATVLSWIFTSDHAVLAELDGRAVGFALTTRSQDADYAYLVRVATLPSVHGRGIGRQLVADAVSFARTTDAAGLALNTQASNTISRRLYESLGFRATGQALAVMVFLT
jgi:GNAT superfamily N-acetyltransferase